MIKDLTGMMNQPIELTFLSMESTLDPFNCIELNVQFSDMEGRELRIPAFWVGGKEWHARFSADKIGIWKYRSECSVQTDIGLHGIEGEVEITPYTGSSALYSHGPSQVSSNGRYFEHKDKTPFFWLGDTWWSIMTDRVSWPVGFKKLAEDRVKKGYSVVQVVIGFNPETLFDDPRNANEGGKPWVVSNGEYYSINPAYFDAVDQRITWLLEQSVVSCIVGSWGYHLKWISVEKMNKHWRYLVA